MRVLHLAMHDNTGAGRAALRLHQGLVSLGEESFFLVNRKTSNSASVIGNSFVSATLIDAQLILLSKLSKKVLNGTGSAFSINLTRSWLSRKIRKISPDVIHLHWVGWEFLRIEELKKLQVPLVWTMHDMWPFTGGCHYSQACDRYTQTCGQCPQLLSGKEQDLSRWVWQRKAAAWKDLDLEIVAPSSWMADCAGKSSLFKSLHPIKVIPVALDTAKYKPIAKRVARTVLGLPNDKQIILFGALGATDDPRKGFHLLKSAMQDLASSGWGAKAEVAVFGSPKPKNPLEIGFKVHYLDQLHDDLSLSIVYSAADVMIVPSLQESFGQTASEALACGTPVVAFNATGLKDIVDHQINGYLAQPYDPTDLASGIVWVLADAERQIRLGQAARTKAEQRFSIELQAQAYSKLYAELLDQRLHDFKLGDRASIQP